MMPAAGLQFDFGLSVVGGADEKLRVSISDDYPTDSVLDVSKN